MGSDVVGYKNVYYFKEKKIIRFIWRKLWSK